MLPSVRQALPFVAALRSRRFRVPSLVLLALMLLAQTALIVHRIDHARAEHGAVCALCVAADQAAAPSHVAPVALSPPVPDTATASVPTPAAARVVLPYRSRAPPQGPHRA
jgi:hypothetical protein